MNVLARAGALLLPRRSARAIGPIGIDFSLDSVHLVQLETSEGKPPQVRARASLPFDCPRADVLENAHRFRSLLRRALDAGPFYGRTAVIAIPSGMFRTVSVNFKCGADNEGAAVLEVMRNRLDGNLSDYVIDYLPVKSLSKNDERLALVAVSEKPAIVNFLEFARKARLEVEALEIGPVAISRLVGTLSRERGAGNVLVMNSGRRASYLTLISDTDLLFDQEVAFGENGLIQQAAEALDMPGDMIRDHLQRSGIAAQGTEYSDFGSTMAEILKPRFLKLVDEIKRVCMYAAAETRGGAVSQIYLLGSIARWPGTDVLLSSLTGFNVEKIPDPLALFAPAERSGREDAGRPAPEIAVATGAALRGVWAHG
ncbi:MAG: pilus assembly protein PilM [Woeseiaceae bacterium]|nr:pilus assembly protein PilM [Woeseiaceae bacterium]